MNLDFDKIENSWERIVFGDVIGSILTINLLLVVI